MMPLSLGRSDIAMKKAAVQGNLNGGFNFGPRSGAINAKA